jgi:hypothetical protein
VPDVEIRIETASDPDALAGGSWRTQHPDAFSGV